MKNALDSLLMKDTYLAQSVVQGDDDVDAMEKEIDHECLRSIAMRQPVREELRFVFAVLKTITDIERIGDEAVNIAEWTIELEKYHRPDMNSVISEMRYIVETMLQDALKAFRTSDAELALDICRRDDHLDRMYADAFDEFIELMASSHSHEAKAAKSTATVRVGAGQMWVTRHLERVGDHITNIAERVYFMATGDTLQK